LKKRGPREVLAREGGCDRRRPGWRLCGGWKRGRWQSGGKRWAPLEECAESQAGRAEGTAVLAWQLRRPAVQ